MKKEVIIAVLIGLGMGLIITYGFYRVNTTVSTQNVSEVTEILPDSTSQSAILSVHSPENDSVQTESASTVAGTTIPNAFVVIFVNDVEQITTADESGNFSLEVELNEGPNTITVIVADNDGNTYQQIRTVVVSDLLEVLEAENTEESAESTESATIE